jgi:hypothetical protein
MKARPTEYRGITFDSKSEARIALYLDHVRCKWAYHPNGVEASDGYRPDFMLVNIADGRNPFYALGDVSINLIEYKPSLPTQTYMNELAGRFDQCVESVCRLFTWCDMIPLDVRCCLFVGGMGYSAAESCYYTRKGEWSSWRPGWCSEWIGQEIDATMKSLSGYRFDLEHQEVGLF